MKCHYEAASVAGNEVARYNLGCKEYESGNMERVIEHWLIAASAGEHSALNNLLISFNQGLVSRNTINITLTAYNSSCAEMRSEARDTFIITLNAMVGDKEKAINITVGKETFAVLVPRSNSVIMLLVIL